MKGTNRVLSGILLFGAGAIILWYTSLLFSHHEITSIEGFVNSFAAPSLLVGVFLIIFGFLLYIDGRTLQKQRYRKKTRGDHPKKPEGELPEKNSLEEPAKKTCPACKKGVYKDARVCRFCGHQFDVTYRLKVYRPEDNERYVFLVDQLTKKLGETPDEIKHLLDVGIRFKYSSKQNLQKHKTRFERLGCPTEVYEKVARE